MVVDLYSEGLPCKVWTEGTSTQQYSTIFPPPSEILLPLLHTTVSQHSLGRARVRHVEFLTRLREATLILCFFSLLTPGLVHGEAAT